MNATSGFVCRPRAKKLHQAVHILLHAYYDQEYTTVVFSYAWKLLCNHLSLSSVDRTVCRKQQNWEQRKDWEEQNLKRAKKKQNLNQIKLQKAKTENPTCQRRKGA
jgi:hypothetical protein